MFTSYSAAFHWSKSVEGMRCGLHSTTGNRSVCQPVCLAASLAFAVQNNGWSGWRSCSWLDFCGHREHGVRRLSRSITSRGEGWEPTAILFGLCFYETKFRSPTPRRTKRCGLRQITSSPVNASSIEIARWSGSRNKSKLNLKFKIPVSDGQILKI